MTKSSVLSVWEVWGCRVSRKVLQNSLQKANHGNIVFFLGGGIREQRNIKSTTKPLMTILDITEVTQS